MSEWQSGDHKGYTFHRATKAVKGNMLWFKIYLKLARWLRAWIELVEAVVVILTLGIYSPMWSFKVLSLDAKICMKLRKFLKI